MTAVNDKQLTASTMEVSFPDSTFEYDEATPQSGVPFVILLRQMLHFSGNYHQMMQILRESRRTRNLILGLGDGPGEWFNSVQYRSDLDLISSTKDVVNMLVKVCLNVS